MLKNKLNFSQSLVMGVLNTTPDSFSDGGKFITSTAIQKRLRIMQKEGADIVDIGGESSAPGALKISAKEEIARILPALDYCRKQKMFVSTDTYKTEVAALAIQKGAQMINDITALRGDKKLASLIAQTGVYVVLMYAKDASAFTTKKEIRYHNVIRTIKNFLAERVNYALGQGIRREQIILDPGMGAFVSTYPTPSLQILKHLGEFKILGFPILIGASRKSFIGQVLNLPITERLEGSLSAAAIAVYNGADIIRTHDVQATKRVITLSAAIKNS